MRIIGDPSEWWNDPESIFSQPGGIADPIKAGGKMLPEGRPPYVPPPPNSGDFPGSPGSTVDPQNPGSGWGGESNLPPTDEIPPVRGGGGSRFMPPRAPLPPGVGGAIGILGGGILGLLGAADTINSCLDCVAHATAAARDACDQLSAICAAANQLYGAIFAARASGKGKNCPDYVDELLRRLRKFANAVCQEASDACNLWRDLLNFDCTDHWNPNDQTCIRLGGRVRQFRTQIDDDMALYGEYVIAWRSFGASCAGAVKPVHTSE